MRLSSTYIGARFTDEDLSDMILDGTFIGVAFLRVSLCRAELTGVFIAVTFCDVDLRDAVIEARSFIRVRFTNAILPDGRMTE